MRSDPLLNATLSLDSGNADGGASSTSSIAYMHPSRYTLFGGETLRPGRIPPESELRDVWLRHLPGHDILGLPTNVPLTAASNFSLTSASRTWSLFVSRSARLCVRRRPVSLDHSLPACWGPTGGIPDSGMHASAAADASLVLQPNGRLAAFFSSSQEEQKKLSWQLSPIRDCVRKQCLLVVTDSGDLAARSARHGKEVWRQVIRNE